MQRRRPCGDRDRDWSHAATARELLGPPGAGNNKDSFSFRNFRGTVALLTPGLGPSILQDRERVSLCCLKPLHLWSLVMAALENDSTTRLSEHRG